MPDYLQFPIRSTKISLSVQVSKHICSRKTPFQTVDIYDTEALGKVLLLDGHVQLATFDEFAYHESLVHIPLLSVTNPKRALVVGGGDGGVLRELVKHPLVKIDMVEIDAEVIESSKKYLPEVCGGGFEDPRVSVHIEDAFAFVKRIESPYDLIVMDVTDVYEGEDGALSERLFTGEFHDDCLKALSNDGFLVTQADNHVFCPYSMSAVLEEFNQVFAESGSYQALVPSFGGFSGFAWGSKGPQVRAKMPDTMITLRYLNPCTWDLAIAGGDPGGFFG